MLTAKPVSLSERCRLLARECKAKANSFRNSEPRAQMFKLAADYERKAKQAEKLELTLAKSYNDCIGSGPDSFGSSAKHLR